MTLVRLASLIGVALLVMVLNVAMSICTWSSTAI